MLNNITIAHIAKNKPPKMLVKIFNALLDFVFVLFKFLIPFAKSTSAVILPI